MFSAVRKLAVGAVCIQTGVKKRVDRMNAHSKRAARMFRVATGGKQVIYAGNLRARKKRIKLYCHVVGRVYSWGVVPGWIGIVPTKAVPSRPVSPTSDGMDPV